MNLWGCLSGLCWQCWVLWWWWYSYHSATAATATAPARRNVKATPRCEEITSKNDHVATECVCVNKYYFCSSVDYIYKDSSL